MKQQEDDAAAEYEPTTELLLDMASSSSPPPTNRRRRPDLNMGCFHLLIHGVMRCLQELKTICGNTLERRGHHRQTYQAGGEEENTPLLTDNYVQSEDYPSVVDNGTSNQVTALDQAMASFVETNDPDALFHVFDVAIKDDKQD